jgi:hypothetical protein
MSGMATTTKWLAAIPLLTLLVLAPNSLAQNASLIEQFSNEDDSVLPPPTSTAAFPSYSGSDLVVSTFAIDPCPILDPRLSAKSPADVRQSAIQGGCGPTKTANSQAKSSMLPFNPCRGNLLVDISVSCFPRLAVGFAESSSSILAADAGERLAAPPPREKFHTGAAMLQSLEFLILEHGFRLANDSYARYLLFHKPFWKDYLSSAEHFDMSRWGDGDDFLVNYIGHPLEGSVSGNIFIQNDPKGRAAKFGKSNDYWQSRFKAMVWAGFYSAYFEIGPVLSEASIGNEGGYTYIPQCGFYPTCDQKPGKTYKPPTNNTGWVDFVITPVVGMGWIVLEDFIEADFVDKLANGGDSRKLKVLRGALAPSKTMSNLLAGKLPWYRDNGPREVVKAFGAPPPVRSAGEWPEWKNQPRWDLGIQLISASLPMDWNGCNSCRVFAPGVGTALGYRLTQFIYLDSEFNLFPGSTSAGGHGAAEEGLVGVRVGRTSRSWGIFSQLRPGFVHYEKALVPGSSSDYESTTRFALDLGASVEYYASRHSTFRFNRGTTLIHYLTGHVDPQQPPVSVLSTDYYATQGSFRVTSGYIYRF